MTDAVFYYDFSSPYSYLAAARIDDLLPQARWRPIVFGSLIQEIGKVPWSLRPGRDVEMAEIERRVADRGLPPLRWPEGWPRDSYSVLPLRAALAAQRHGRLKPASHALYAVAFAEGRRLDGLDHVLDAVVGQGLDREDLKAAMDSPEVRDELRSNTARALSRGVTGVPTVAVGEELFWGDDRLEEAAAAQG